MMRKYTVNQSVWIAAALYAYTKCEDGKVQSEEDLCLKASQLQQLAQQYAKSDVQLARIHQHLSGDHENCSNRFIRRVELDPGHPVFRVAAKGEFDGDREWPDDLILDDEIEFEGQTFSIREMKEFVDGELVQMLNSFEVISRSVTKWMVPGNPEHFDIIGAFTELGKIDWRQTINAQVGDIVYVYVSGPIKEIRFKCRVNETDIEDVEIEDDKFNISGEQGGVYDRYMELEAIREYSGSAYGREELLKHGFMTLRGPMRVPQELQKYLDSLEEGSDGSKMPKNKDRTEFGKNLILYGPPGTGKTYKSAIIAVNICDPSFDTSDYSAVMKRYDELKAENRIAFTTFHQSYGYEEFIEGIKPIVDGDNSEIGYKIDPGCFKRFCEIARTPASISLAEDQRADEEKPYVFIIDEINRGNISKIFGELITLIEHTKREGMDEAASAILPYSGEAFSVPSNVYILGTMNTADRSIALMDTALRRRFSFVEMMPDADVLRRIGADVVEDEGETVDIAAMLEKINARIEYLYDREHTIGHAFFTGLAKDASIEKLAAIFEKSVIPLLQEYFYEDYQKIQLVLGDNAKSDPELKFISDSKVDLKDLFMGNVEDVVDEREVRYSINKKALLNIYSYKSIAENL